MSSAQSYSKTEGFKVPEYLSLSNDGNISGSKIADTFAELKNYHKLDISSRFGETVTFHIVYNLQSCLGKICS